MDTSSGGTTVKAERAVHGRKRLVEEGGCRDKVLARRDKRIEGEGEKQNAVARRAKMEANGVGEREPRSRPGEFLMARWDRKIRRKKGPPWLRGRAESAIISQKRRRVFGTNCFLARKQCCQISLGA